MKILECTNLIKIYGKDETRVWALDGISLSVEKREFLAVIGTSGSGKSTLLHMLGGLDTPDSGEVIIGGNRLSEMKRDDLTIFQNYNLIPMMNVEENIHLPIGLDGKCPDQEYIGDLIKILGIELKLHAMPGHFSDGQQQSWLLMQ